MARIEVTSLGGSEFTVRADGRGFEVTASEALVEEMGARDAPTLVRHSFEYLLAREPAAAILPRFDLSVIERYHPGWRVAMRRLSTREGFSADL